MIRKVYLDFIREKIAKKQFGWLLSRSTQYALVHASYLARKPLCGPILGTLVTNYRCNFDCVMCDLKLRDRELQERGLKEFDTAGMKRMIDGFAKLGVSGIGFTGGEPLLRSDIFELLAYTKHLGMITHLNTNGSLLNDKNVRNMFEAGVDSLNISLDGATAATHDAIRGFPGAFDRAMAALQRTTAFRKQTGSPLRIKTVAVIQEKNIDEIAELIELSASLGVDCVEFIPQQGFASGAKERTEADDRFLEQVARLEDFLIGFESDRIKIENSPADIRMFGMSFRDEPSPLRCYAGYSSYAVDSYGEIYPCVPWYNWRKSVGNVLDQDMVKFWYSAGYDRVRKEVKACRGCYLGCQVELNILFNPLAGRKSAVRSRRHK